MRRTFNHFLYLLAGLPAAVAWFGLLLAGWLAAALLAVTPLLGPVLVAFRWATRGLALGDAALARGLLGRDVRVPAAAPTGRGYLNRIRGTLRDGAFWQQQAYGAIRTTAGFGAGVAAASAVGGSLYLVFLPVYYCWVDQWQVHSLGRAFAAVPVGLAALGVSALLVRALARALAGAARGLLGSGAGAAAPVAAAGGAGPRRTGLREHAAAYGLVGVLCVLVWALTTRAYFWPVWPLLGLGVPLAVHALVVRALALPRRWRGVAIDAGTLGVVAVFLVAAWAVTSRGYFWPMWPIIAFVLTAGAHALAVRRGALERRIDVLETTRAGAVDAAESELRRIERDLHDGAQARLVALGMSLGLAEQRLAEDPSSARRLLEEARAGAEEALRELRDLARGIHPPVLADRGLEAALAALVARSPLPVDLEVRLPLRPPAAQETAAYFVAAEALANASKHADASHVGIRVGRVDGTLLVRVEDDGRGGADAAGRGLRGLAQRGEALDGTVRVTSPAGGPTVVEAVLPCGS
ncbi:MAG TPA: sensor domain-containing protein [Gaiellaceae bacterium]|nr:sensor domain-containing protein [Gaiellaceae bacterium]